MIGIGASAGGLQALEAFFDAMPCDSGMIFVVVTHQSAQHESQLPSLLSKRTRMVVETAQDGAVAAPNHVYVNPPGQNLALLNRTFQAMDVDTGVRLHHPIDYFFRSLARDQGDRGICIVLSGTGTDGTLGLRAIKAQSGLAILQEEHSARHAGMPLSAAATQLADHILTPEQMPAQLLAFARMTTKVAPGLAWMESKLEKALPKIFVLLRNRTGHDFSGYKPTTMSRRIVRRMRVHEISTPDDYIDFLQKEPHELDLLFQELLITVTQFFRDPEAFSALDARLTSYLERHSDRTTLRVWVCGCATGEEAYSIAILIRELAERAGRRLDLQMFATDLDSRAIEIARAGRYPAGIAADVSAARLERFFVVDGTGYRIRKEVRDSIVFAPQNLVRDPPFTKLDLLSCRNLLIYLDTELLQRVWPLFHYSLVPGGLLWVGTSESVASEVDLFAGLDTKWRIYERRNSARSAAPGFDLRLPSKVEPGSLPRRAEEAPLAGIVQSMEGVLLERFVPPTLVVNEHGDIAYFFGRTGNYLELGGGAPTHNVFAMARESLQLSLRTAMRMAATGEGEFTQREIPMGTRADDDGIDVTVRRISEPESLRGLFRVSFVAAPATNKEGTRAEPLPTDTSQEHTLETELRHTRDSLQGTIGELQASNEELKAANEELRSTNEELQSTNEELETAKEEMQSLNEELQTLNGELHSKVSEFSELTDDMQNLLNSTEIATLFLGRDLTVRRFTEQVRQIVRLIPTDVGRPIWDLVSHIDYDNFRADVEQVLRTLVAHETEVQTHDGHWLLVRILPYQTATNVIKGVVITFIGIDRLRRAESLAGSRAMAENIVQTVREPLAVLDHDYQIVASNRAFVRLLELTPHEVEAGSWFALRNGMFAIPELQRLLDAVLTQGEGIEAFEFSHMFSSNRSSRIQLNARRLNDVKGTEGTSVRALVGLNIVNVSPSDTVP